ncbi:integrase core domain-containing protein [Oceaniovalibus sp. ACAM 378]|uniref:integrase core domain-containing protein n=1 Tax=Oceaniovalibus sp. ACAM 378 TaxID=2599923 RepID=UPI0016524777|nr:integrase core domain-containing protein [Oceaniovalibus sp. ACAM 378]
MKVTMEKLGVTASYSRPLSNHNPFSEVLFRTCKYRPDWPGKGFATTADAQAWVKSFASWYNGGHLHSAIRFITPNARHARHARHDHATLASRAIPYANVRAQTRNAGKAKPGPGNLPDPSGSARRTKSAPLKSATLHEIGGQLL